MPVDSPTTRRLRQTGAARKNKTRKGSKAKQGDEFKQYYTVSMGKKVYEVYINTFDFLVKIYKLEGDKGKYTRGELILELQRPNIEYGDNWLDDKQYEPITKYHSNSFLFKTKQKGRYIFAGHKIYSFSTIDNDIFSIFPLLGTVPYGPAQYFYSPMGKDGTPYPYAIGKKYLYFFREHVAVPRELFDLTKDAYRQFYGKGISTAQKKKIDSSKKEFKVRIIDSGLEGN